MAGVIAAVSAAAVGLVFLTTGALKALDPRPLLVQLSLYGLLPERLQRPAAVAVAAGEVGLGLALVAGAWPAAVVPAALAVVVGFAALTIWGAASGRIEECGCYGGLLRPSLRQSLGLDALYAALLVAAWSGEGPRWWAAVAALGAAAVAALVARRSIDSPVLRPALRAGAPWRARWLAPGPHDLGTGEHLVALLGADCPHCAQWVPVLNVMAVQSDFPEVLAVVRGGDAGGDEFAARHGARFPVVSMPRLLFGTLVAATPTAVLVRDGRIEAVWVGDLPPAYVERVTQFFRTVTPRKRPATSVFKG